MITSNNGFTKVENISLSQELAVLGISDTPFTSLLLSKGVKKALNTVHSWQEKSFATDGETDAVEGADVTTFQQSTKRVLNNTLQIFLRAVSISGTANAMQSTKFSSEVADRLYELKLKLESVLINGIKDDGSVTGIRKMAGLIAQADSNNAIAHTGAVTEKLIKDAMKKLWDNKLQGGTYYAFVNSELKDQIDEIYKDKYSYQHVESKFGLLVDQIRTNFSDVQIVISRDVPDNQIVFFNDSYLSAIALREAHFEVLGKNGDNQKGMIVGEYSLEVGTPKAVVVVTVTP
ncbi:DUF5309 family protein [Psychrobacillus sp. NPDC096426]|uniref:SU10 major capsid protein n=1 Tax=Psychrobacillus sp. NPDC096426 TaxID=3364491 RepID=UPI00380E1865